MIDWQARKISAAVRKFKPKIVLIEGHAYSKNQSGTAVRHELAGVVKNRLHRMEIPFVILDPRSLKLWFTGSGSASKEDMIAFARSSGFPNCDDDNLADAFALAKYGNDEYDSLVDA